MFFQNPSAALLFLLVLPYVWLFFVKPRKRSEVVTTIIFWNKTLAVGDGKSWGAQLKNFWSPLLGLIFLLLLTLAAMLPVVNSDSQNDEVFSNTSVSDYFCEHCFISAQPVKKVLFYGKRDNYLVTALNALPDTEFEEISHCPEIVPTDSVLVIYENNPTAVPKGNVLIIDPQNESDFFTVESSQVESVRQNGILTRNKNSQDVSESLLMKNLDFSDVKINFSKKISIVNGDFLIRTLAETGSGEAVYVNCETSDSKTRLVILSVDISKGDFAQKTIFPILISNVIEYFKSPVISFEIKSPQTSTEYPIWLWLVVSAIVVFGLICVREQKL